MGTMEKKEKQNRDRGDPRPGYGNTDEINKERNRHQEDAPQTPEEIPHEKGPDPDQRPPERAGA